MTAPSLPPPAGAVPAEGAPHRRGVPRGRPLGVWVVAGAHVVVAGLSILAFLGVPGMGPGAGEAILLASLGDVSLAISAVSAIAIVLAVGLLRLAPWGWYGAMLYTGVGLAVQIILFSRGHAHSLYLLLHVIEAFYLNQADVRRIFQRAPERPA